MAGTLSPGGATPQRDTKHLDPDLLAILEARRDDYARAEGELDTSGQTLDESFTRLVKLVGSHMDGKKK